MPAIDTIASYQGTSGSTLATGTMAAGDSATIRSFPPAGECRLIGAFYDDVTSVEAWRVRSPLLHDNVHGIEFWPGASASRELLPAEMTQKLQAQDALIFELSTAATTGKALGALLLYYSQLPGAAARLYNPGDIKPLVKNIKPLEVTITSGSNTAGAWYDAALTATEDLLHANTDYAVLGIVTDVALACVGIKGIDTGNLRVSAPGSLNDVRTPFYFVDRSMRLGLPCIPVINAANAASTYVSIVSSAATAADAHIQVILAELSSQLS